jgi:hypothetical protein
MRWLRIAGVTRDRVAATMLQDTQNTQRYNTVQHTEYTKHTAERSIAARVVNMVSK